MSEQTFPESWILECGHCGNRTPHTRILLYEHELLFDELGDERLYETFSWLSYACATCGGLNVYGEFYGVTGIGEFARTRLHPKASELVPPTHMVSPARPVPERVVRLYQEVWPLRHRAPAAFVGQIRRLLEYVCSDQGASGNSLFEKLRQLTSTGTFPGYFANITDLLRVVGNMGAHAVEAEISVWDAELIDDFFRSTIEYVYVAPAKIRRMRERLRKSAEKSGPTE